MLSILPLTEFNRTDLARAGGKGANLGALLRAGLPVPPGFCITTDAYRGFCGSQPAGEEIIRQCAAGSTRLTGSSRRPPIHPRPLRRRTLPLPWRTKSRQAYAAFVTLPCGRGGRALLGHRRRPARPVLCRAAGYLPQHHRRGSLLRGGGATAGPACGRRARSATALRNGISQARGVALAVVVQQMVPSEARACCSPPTR